jgi:hypothetical protein
MRRRLTNFGVVRTFFNWNILQDSRDLVEGWSSCCARLSLSSWQWNLQGSPFCALWVTCSSRTGRESSPKLSCPIEDQQRILKLEISRQGNSPFCALCVTCSSHTSGEASPKPSCPIEDQQRILKLEISRQGHSPFQSKGFWVRILQVSCSAFPGQPWRVLSSIFKVVSFQLDLEKTATAL